jgi:hypothetical protein
MDAEIEGHLVTDAGRAVNFKRVAGKDFSGETP